MKINIEKIKSEKSVRDLLEFGVINIDKPSGPTSFDVSDLVRKILGLRKTSHFGTLDPQVSGVLPIALNRACKLTGFFLGEDKEYVGIMRIHEEISIKDLQEVIGKRFLGKIMQKPPVKSRVARVLREREVKVFEILEQDQDKKGFLFKTEVQGGTYIRKLIHDLGEVLGIGAHMLELRRTRAGVFREEKSHTLYELEEAVEEYQKGDDKKLKGMIIPGEIISEIFPVVQIKEDSVDRVLHGQPIYNENLIKKYSFDKETNVSVFSGDKFIGVFKVVNEDRVFAKAEFVLQPVK